LIEKELLNKINYDIVCIFDFSKSQKDKFYILIFNNFNIYIYIYIYIIYIDNIKNTPSLDPRNVGPTCEHKMYINKRGWS